MGGSAGAPSALQLALRHPDRVSALVLSVPLAYKPPTQADSAPPLPAWVERRVMQLIGSDFLFRAGLHVARDTIIKLVLATPPELLIAASPQERARIDRMLDNILPVSARDDRYGTFATAQSTASQIAGARFIGFDQGGHTWVGHDDEVMEAIRALVVKAGRP